MSHLIANGTYRFKNVKFPGSVINLAGGQPLAAITGWPGDSTSFNLRWKVTNLPNNRVTLESAAAAGYYASTYNYAEFSPLFGAPNPTYYTVEKVGPGFRLLAEDKLAVTLTESGKEVSIYLRSVGAVPAEEQLWTLEH